MKRLDKHISDGLRARSEKKEAAYRARVAAQGVAKQGEVREIEKVGVAFSWASACPEAVGLPAPRLSAWDDSAKRAALGPWGRGAVLRQGCCDKRR